MRAAAGPGVRPGGPDQQPGQRQHEERQPEARREQEQQRDPARHGGGIAVGHARCGPQPGLAKPASASTALPSGDRT